MKGKKVLVRGNHDYFHDERYISNNKAVIWALNKERLINSGFYDLATAYQSVHVNY